MPPVAENDHILTQFPQGMADFNQPRDLRELVEMREADDFYGYAPISATASPKPITKITGATRWMVRIRV
jgi:hypothetical protein